MISEKVLYTDGHEVTVTNSFFKVKKTLYQLKGITKHRLFIIHPDKLTPILTLVFGAMMIVLGSLHMISASYVPDIEFKSIQIGANEAALGLGAGLIFLAALVMGLKKDRYAIRIDTAEGEKNVVVSPKREYVTQILDALNHAFLNFTPASRVNTERVMKIRNY